MSKTKIEWTERVWNPVTGCTKVSQGCKHCYAERVFPRPYPGRAFTDVQCHPDRLTVPLRWRKPARVFVNSMSDLFHDDVPEQFITDVFGIMALAHWHTFQILTKRPKRMLEYLSRGDHGIIEQFRAIQDGGGIGPREMFRALDLKRRDKIEWRWPLPNVWLGVSVENQATADERIPLLLDTPAAVRWVSAEPLLGPLDLAAFRYHLPDAEHGPACTVNAFGQGAFSDPSDQGFDWVVVGGESGPHARPMHPEWARSLRDQCQAAGVPFFFKQWGEWKPISEMPEAEHAMFYVSRVAAKEHENQDDIDDIMGKRCTVETRAIGFDGEEHWELRYGHCSYLTFRVGKKLAGSLLDGVEWKQYPKVQA